MNSPKIHIILLAQQFTKFTNLTHDNNIGEVHLLLIETFCVNINIELSLNV